VKKALAVVCVFAVLSVSFGDDKKEEKVSVEKLLGRLRHEPFHAELICDEIVKLGKSALPALASVSKEDDLCVKEAARKCTAAITWQVSPRCFYALAGGFSDITYFSHIPLSDALWEKIKRLRSAGNSDGLLDIVRTGHPSTSFVALKAIESIGKEAEAAKSLLDSVRSNNWFYAGALLAHSPKKVLPCVLEKLRSMKENDRLGAASALTISPSSDAVAALLKTLKYKSSLVRLKVAQALGATGDKRALDPLIKRLKEDTDYTVRAEAAWALGMLESAEKAATTLTGALKDQNNQVRNRAIESLAVIGGKTALDALSAHARDAKNSSPARNRAIRAIAQIGGKEALERLKPLLGKSDEAYSMVPSVIGSLGKVALPLIRETMMAAADSDLKTVRKCRLALSTMGAEAIPLLLDLLESQKNILRLTARTLLRALIKEKKDFEYDRAKWEEYFKKNLPKEKEQSPGEDAGQKER
jgi:HEAT repeat protein